MLTQPRQMFLAFLFVRETENLDIYMKSFKCCKPAVPNLFGTRDQFHGRPLFHGPRGGGDGFRMIQTHNIYCALSFYYYYISSPSSSAIRSRGVGAPVVNKPLIIDFCSKRQARQNKHIHGCHLCHRIKHLVVAALSGI